ncbi:HNH endonuclease [Paenibacillus kandeliae]|uniref:HNH endonuclease n=1 Tax=Paenibacillus kandeliae TaxID=3231269 RepID=UPI00345AE132
MSLFAEEYPSLESYWRSVILFGRNVATYKFALAKSLLDLSPQANTFISLEELAVPFAGHIAEHLKINDKQITSPSSKFIDACRQWNNQAISQDELIQTAVRYGFNNVLDAFHIVNQDEIAVRFFKSEKREKTKGIIITDDLFKLKETTQAASFNQEIESRWRLVETAWSINLAPSLMQIQYDEIKGEFFIDSSSSDKLRRTNITSARGSLNGYQKGKCFYCFDDIHIDPNHDMLADVDHFFPHTLQSGTHINLDGVWNLVLACKKCNRGENGKFAKIPEVRFLERLHKRNSFFINSHHPLRETLINQTGKTEQERIAFLKSMDSVAINLLIHRWQPTFEFAPAF